MDTIGSYLLNIGQTHLAEGKKVYDQSSERNVRFGAKGASQTKMLSVRFCYRGGYTSTMFTCHITMQMQADAAKAAPLI